MSARPIRLWSEPISSRRVFLVLLSPASGCRHLIRNSPARKKKTLSGNCQPICVRPREDVLSSQRPTKGEGERRKPTSPFTGEQDSGVSEAETGKPGFLAPGERVSTFKTCPGVDFNYFLL